MLKTLSLRESVFLKEIYQFTSEKGFAKGYLSSYYDLKPPEGVYSTNKYYRQQVLYQTFKTGCLILNG